MMLLRRLDIRRVFLSKIPQILFLFSLLVSAYCYGAITVKSRIFPYTYLQRSLTTAIGLLDALEERSSSPVFPALREKIIELNNALVGPSNLRTPRPDSSEGNVATRISIPGELDPDHYTQDNYQEKRLTTYGLPTGNEHILITGGAYNFREYCPKLGCIAVELTHDGKLVHAYPYRPEEIVSADKIVDEPHESVLFDATKQTSIMGMQSFSNGDLLVTFVFEGTFPWGAGTARINPEGHPVWVRMDYSHHWPTLASDNDALVPGNDIRNEKTISVGMRDGIRFDVSCERGRFAIPTINVLDGSGNTKDEIDVLASFMNSSYSGMLFDPPDSCNLLHENSVQRVPADMAAALPGIEEGDIIVSLRDIDAIGVIGKISHQFKRVFRGTWVRQHSVQLLRGSKILLFDNLGGGPDGKPSRLLEVDLANGAERTIFPKEGQPKPFSSILGNLSVSKDRERAIITFVTLGEAYEIRLSDGAILTKIKNLQDLRDSPRENVKTEDQSHIATLRNSGVYYVQ